MSKDESVRILPKPLSPDQPRKGIGDAPAADVEAQLARVLNSAAFKGSKRSQDFLRHIVSQALKANEAGLKERALAIDVFGRDPAYNNAEDSIVRVTAHDVRKRLTQYYSEAGVAGELLIQLPAGSYSPEFHRAQPAESPAPATPVLRTARWRRPGVACVIVIFVALAGLWLWRALGEWRTPLDRFWGPVIAASKSVVVCVGQPAVIALRGPAEDRLATSAFRQRVNGLIPLQLKPEDLADARLTFVPDEYVGVGDTLAVFRLSELFHRLRLPAQLKVVRDLPYSELGQSPAVLIGAFSNIWTLETNRDVRFIFRHEGGHFDVVDRSSAGKVWSVEVTGTGQREDYAIVSRLLNQPSRRPLIVVAGCTQFGTGAAAEFITSTEHMEEFAKSAPADWEKRNLQIVLRIAVRQRSPGAPEVVAFHSW